MKITITTLAVTLLLVSTACTQIPVDGRYDPEKGWRKGKVDAVSITQAAAVSETPECRAVYSALPSQTRFVKIHYVKYGEMILHRVALEPSGLSLVVGDSVQVNVHDCSGTVVKVGS